jgi:hypothetical protein
MISRIECFLQIIFVKIVFCVPRAPMYSDASRMFLRTFTPPGNAVSLGSGGISSRICSSTSQSSGLRSTSSHSASASSSVIAQFPLSLLTFVGAVRRWGTCNPSTFEFFLSHATFPHPICMHERRRFAFFVYALDFAVPACMGLNFCNRLARTRPGPTCMHLFFEYFIFIRKQPMLMAISSQVRSRDAHVHTCIYVCIICD